MYAVPFIFGPPCILDRIHDGDSDWAWEVEAVYATLYTEQHIHCEKLE